MVTVPLNPKSQRQGDSSATPVAVSPLEGSSNYAMSLWVLPAQPDAPLFLVCYPQPK